MHIIHISAECYPVAKAGGLGDVVGSLPKYQVAQGSESWVVIPAYDVPWIHNHEFETTHQGFTHLAGSWFDYSIKREKHNMSRLAERTGLERTHLYRKLKQLGIPVGKKSEE